MPKIEKFEDCNIIEYTWEAINRYLDNKNELKLNYGDNLDLEPEAISEQINITIDFLDKLESLLKYIKNDKKDNSNDKDTIDEILKYCMRTMNTLKNNNSEFANGMLAACKYIYYGIIANKIDNGEDVERYRT
jgi:hypothetical protein